MCSYKYILMQDLVTDFKFMCYIILYHHHHNIIIIAKSHSQFYHSVTIQIVS